MKQVFVFLFCLSYLFSNSQNPISGKWHYIYVGGDSVLFIPGDTVQSAPINSIATKSGVMYVKGAHWVAIGGGGSPFYDSTLMASAYKVKRDSITLATAINTKQPTISFPNSTHRYYNGYGNFSVLSTDSVFEDASHLYYHDANARAAISLTTTGTSWPATYNNSTGVLNIPQVTGGGSTDNLDSIFRRSTKISNSYSVSMGSKKINLDSASLALKFVDSPAIQLFGKKPGVMARFWPVDHSATDPDYKPFDIILEDTNDGGGLWNQPFKMGFNIGGKYNSSRWGIHRSTESMFHPGGAHWFEQHDPVIFYPGVSGEMRASSWTIALRNTIHESSYTYYMKSNSYDFRIPTDGNTDTSLLTFGYNQGTKTGSYAFSTSMGAAVPTGIVIEDESNGQGVMGENLNSAAVYMGFKGFPIYSWQSAGVVTMSLDAALGKLTLQNSVQADSIIGNRLFMAANGGLYSSGAKYINNVGTWNDIIGQGAMGAGFDGNSYGFNTVMGTQTFASINSGSIAKNNSVFGARALFNATSGSHNSIFGANSLNGISDVNNSIIIGDSSAYYGAGIQSNYGWSNWNNKLWIDDRPDSIPVIYSDMPTKSVGIGMISDFTGAKLAVAGKVYIQTIDSSAIPLNMLFQGADGLVYKAAVPTGGGGGSDTANVAQVGAGVAIGRMNVTKDTLQLFSITNQIANSDSGRTIKTLEYADQNLTRNTAINLSTNNLTLGATSTGQVKFNGAKIGNSASGYTVMVHNPDSAFAQVPISTFMTDINVTDGLYTPTVSSTSNVASSTAHEINWARQNNTFYISGYITITPTLTATVTTFDISLPNGTWGLPDIGKIAGNGQGDGVALGVVIMGNTGTGNAKFKFTSVGTSPVDIWFKFEGHYNSP